MRRNLVAAGTRLGQYEIIALLGVGGMGEVYRARDEREARLLASLNHPNIGAIYGIEETDGVIALVLELVEGETLGRKLEELGGKGLGIGEALAIARQGCDALAAAAE